MLKKCERNFLQVLSNSIFKHIKVKFIIEERDNAHIFMRSSRNHETTQMLSLVQTLWELWRMELAIIILFRGGFGHIWQFNAKIKSFTQSPLLLLPWRVYIRINNNNNIIGIAFSRKCREIKLHESFQQVWCGAQALFFVFIGRCGDEVIMVGWGVAALAKSGRKPTREAATNEQLSSTSTQTGDGKGRVMGVWCWESSDRVCTLKRDRPWCRVAGGVSSFAATYYLLPAAFHSQHLKQTNKRGKKNPLAGGYFEGLCVLFQVVVQGTAEKWPRSRRRSVGDACLSGQHWYRRVAAGEENLGWEKKETSNRKKGSAGRGRGWQWVSESEREGGREIERRADLYATLRLLDGDGCDWATPQKDRPGRRNLFSSPFAGEDVLWSRPISWSRLILRVSCVEGDRERSDWVEVSWERVIVA